VFASGAIEELWPSTAVEFTGVEVGEEGLEEGLVFTGVGVEELWPSTAIEFTGIEVGEEGLVFAGA
jgi:hypothetical protein